MIHASYHSLDNPIVQNPIFKMAQIDHLLDLAREHVEEIRMNKQSLACLPDHHIIADFPSQELCLDEILDCFNLHQDKLSISVSARKPFLL